MGHDEYLQQGAVISETVADIDRATIIEEIRRNTHRVAKWRCELNVIQANAVDRCIGALGATGENLYDFVPELLTDHEGPEHQHPSMTSSSNRATQ